MRVFLNIVIREIHIQWNAFNRWTGKSHIDKYDNSILYNDFVMKQLFSAVKDLPNFQGLIYVADQADDVDAGLGHDASRLKSK